MEGPLTETPVSTLRERFLDRPEKVTDSILEALLSDRRIGARKLGLRLARFRELQTQETKKIRRMLRFEEIAYQQGHRLVAGVDEAGVGPLAGPVVAAAVIMDRARLIPGVDDSKRLDAGLRSILACRIRESALAFAVGTASVEEIDRLNIFNAGILAMRRAIDGLGLKPDRILLDAREIPHLDTPQLAIKKGDRLSYSIAAASILAKTSRDEMLEQLDRLHPQYGFARHKGYPTAQHKQALQRFGICPAHRRSFAAVHELSPERTPLFHSLQQQIAAAATPKELRRISRALTRRHSELMTPEWKELRALVEVQQRAVSCPLFES